MAFRVDVTGIDDDEWARWFKGGLEKVAHAAGSELETFSNHPTHLNHPTYDSPIETFGYSLSGKTLDFALLPSPVSSIVIQLTLPDGMVRCLSRPEPLGRRGRRVLRRIARSHVGISAGRNHYARVLSELGPVWVLPRIDGVDRASVVPTIERILTATGAVWNEDILGVSDARNQIPDEYDDLVYLLVSECERGTSEDALRDKLHERLRRHYFNEERGSPADFNTAQIAKKLVAIMFPN